MAAAFSPLCGSLVLNCLFTGAKPTPVTNGTSAVWVDAGSNFLLIVLTVGLIILALATIFLYKDRKLQLKLCYAGIGAAALTLILYFVEIKGLCGSYFPFCFVCICDTSRICHGCKRNLEGRKTGEES